MGVKLASMPLGVGVVDGLAGLDPANPALPSHNLAGDGLVAHALPGQVRPAEALLALCLALALALPLPLPLPFGVFCKTFFTVVFGALSSSASSASSASAA
eukprot:196029_1